MNNKFFFTTIVSALLLTASCHNATGVDQILQNETTRKEVFDKITADHELMTELMESTINSAHAKMMMKGHAGMQAMMTGNGTIMNMMNEKPNMMNGMMSEMMRDENMMRNMMQMMHKEGMMSEDCMQSGMKMMGDIGMSMDNMNEHNEDDNLESNNH